MPSSDVAIVEAKSRAEVSAFVEFPYAHYRGDPFFVPPLRSDVRLRLDRARHPFFRFSETDLFLAKRRGVVVGRVAATVNRRHNEFHDEKTGFFGFFECVREFEPAKALLGAAAARLLDKGMTTLRGPASLSMNDECGLLVEGFDGPPVLMMSYNPPWYADLFEGAGLSKATDLLAWRMSEATADLERWRRLNDRVKAREGLTVRPLDLRRFERDVKIVCDLYADAWSKNWGFVPMTNEEIAFMGRQLRPIVLPDLCLFVMKDGREVGFTLALPDVNRVLIDLKGSLFPFGWLKVLLRKNKVGFGRILTLGVRREFHGRGYDALLYHEISSAMVSRGFRDGEMSWILETNDAMNNTIRRAGGEPYRRYRMYEAALSDVAAASS